MEILKTNLAIDLVGFPRHAIDAGSRITFQFDECGAEKIDRGAPLPLAPSNSGRSAVMEIFQTHHKASTHSFKSKRAFGCLLRSNKACRSRVREAGEMEDLKTVIGGPSPARLERLSQSLPIGSRRRPRQST
jgi:hypothetical protein